MLRKVLGPLGRGAFRPDTIPADIVVGLALTPSVLAGLLFFHLAAAEMLAIAVTVGVLAHLGARLAGQPLRISPVIPALVATALIGPGAPLLWVGAAATGAAALEVARSRWLKAVRIETGLLAYSVLFMAGRGILGSYLSPGTSRTLAEPIRLWVTYFGSGPVLPFDPIRMYVGNVPGPVFATSLLAVVIGAGWLWYARRLSVPVLLGFLAGAAVPLWLFRWSPVFQLDSGPAWFAVAIILADREMLPNSGPARPLIGFVAGVAALAARSYGQGIEVVFLVVAGLQVAVVMVEGGSWLGAQRRRIWTRSLEATARLWKGARALPAGRRAA